MGRKKADAAPKLRLEVSTFSATPLYVQLKDSIKQGIYDGVLKAGDRLPTEEEICRRCGVSRMVTNQALRELAAEGYVVRRKGKGSFVSPADGCTRFFREIISFNDEMRRAGHQPTTEVLCQKVAAGPAAICARLAVPAATPLVVLERVRYRDGQALYHCLGYLVAAYFPGLQDVDLTEESLFAVMQKRYGIRVCQAARNFTARLCPAPIARKLGIRPASPMIYIESVESDQHGRPVAYDASYYVGGRSVFDAQIVVPQHHR